MKMTKQDWSDVLYTIAECVCFAVCMLAVVVALASVVRVFENKAHAEPVAVTTINRAEVMEHENSGDSELAHVKFANAIGRITGWNKLSMDEQAVRVKLAGLIIEEVGKCTPKNPITGGFWHSFLRQVGVQMQVQAMGHLDELSHEPAIAFLQGVLIGL